MSEEYPYQKEWEEYKKRQITTLLVTLFWLPAMILSGLLSDFIF
jgi:hypothetical protein